MEGNQHSAEAAAFAGAGKAKQDFHSQGWDAGLGRWTDTWTEPYEPKQGTEGFEKGRKYDGKTVCGECRLGRHHFETLLPGGSCTRRLNVVAVEGALGDRDCSC